MTPAQHITASLVLVLSSPGLSRADEALAPSRRAALYAEAGLGTPVGYFGAEAVLKLAPSWEIASGVGLGLTASRNGSGFVHDLQWSLMPRYRFGGNRPAMTIGLGVSGGNYAHTLDSLCGSQEEELICSLTNWRYTLWANLEIGWEYWLPTGFAVRYFIGYGRVLAQGSEHCQLPPNCGEDVPPGSFPYYDIPYFGLAFGRTF